MVCMDADLRVTDVRTPISAFAGVFDQVTLDSIEATIPEDHDDFPHLDTRFVALGYDVSTTSGYSEGFDWERVKTVEERLSRRGVRLLGIQVSDDESWASTGPMHSFESYALDDLPRAVVIPGPHPFATCECAACAPKPPPAQSGRASLCRLMCKEGVMATNLALDPELLDRAFAISGQATKKAAVTLALREFIARREQLGLLDLVGTLEWDDSFDYKAERSRA